ncbi:hypothetical protein NKH98_30220 [Mesorhizobium sp. M0833]|uniref:hypothetical protein n=1 Tax=unclassified Mesorhizobium TaxID=325217 RepID=UPI0033382975
MIMSVVKSLAPVTLGTVLIAISPASLSASDAQGLAFAHADMPIKQLKDVYLDCGEAAGARGRSASAGY